MDGLLENPTKMDDLGVSLFSETSRGGKLKSNFPKYYVERYVAPTIQQKLPRPIFSLWVSQTDAWIQRWPSLPMSAW